MELAENTLVVKDEAGELQENGADSNSSVFRGNRSHEQLEDLDNWNPMSDDYECKAFNSYKEPSITDFVNAFPGNSSQTSRPSTTSSLKTDQRDIRLFVGRIPQQMTQEGLQNLFRQVGKLSFCNLIPQHNKDTKIGFVGYETVCEAEAAIQKFDGFDLGKGDRLKVALALSKKKPVFADMEERMSDGASNIIQDHIDEGAVLRRDVSLQDGVSCCILPNSNITSTGRPCSFCGQLGLKWCSVCKIPYCSRDCQRNDWPKHKHVCPQQSLAERKPTTPLDTPMSCMKTETPLTSTAGDPVQSTTPALLPARTGDSVQPMKKLSACTAQVVSDQQAEAFADKKDQEDLEIAEVFDVHNAEMFAQMMGFDLTPVKVVDSDSSDTSTSSSLIGESIHQEAVPQTKEPGPQALNTERPAHKPIPEPSIGLESVSPSAVNLTDKGNSAPKRPTCAKGHKRFFIKQLNMESVPSEDFVEVVVTEVENPSCLWVQLCTSDALERQNQLKKILQVSYCDSVYENYVPSGGEVCVAQFSFDSCWYRAKVDVINNTGTLSVTYVDFGNREDMAVDKVRRITEDLVCFPRQALKLCLYGITSTSPSGQWSSESTTFLKNKVLGNKCKVQVCGQHNDILFVKLSDPKESNSDNSINESLVNAGFAENRRQQSSSLRTPKQINLVSQYGSQSNLEQCRSPPTVQPENCDQQTGISNSEMRQANRSTNSSQGQDNACEHQRDNLNQDTSYSCTKAKSPVYVLPPKEQENSPRNPTRPQLRKAPFQAIINAIVNPWEFYAMKTDKQLLDELKSLMQDLNQHITGNSCAPQPPSSLLAPGDICAAQFSLDNVWYRAVILDQVSGGFQVRYMDFGNSEVVQDGGICPLPQQFQSFPPLSLTCSLAGVRKPRGQDWSPEAVQQFRSLVADKPFLCRIVYTHGVTNIVELLDPCQSEEQTVANSLISAGLADAFIPKDENKRQSDAKRGLLFAGRQQLGGGGTPVAKSPSDGNTRRSPLSPQLPGIPNRSERGALPRNGRSGSFQEERIESAVFEPAIQAAPLPQDAIFDILVTEVVSPGLIYCQLGTVESLQNGAKLTQDMNSHYNAVSYPLFVPQKNNICAAHFAKSGDWCRAFIKGVCSDGSVYVHYVDYGNTEMVLPACLRPLLQQFSFDVLPFSALRCSLANILSLDASGWSDEAMTFVKAHLLAFNRYSVRLVGRQRGKLFLDIIAEEESVSQALVNQGLARAMVKANHTKNLPVRESRLNMQRSHQASDNQTGLPRRPHERHNASPLEALVYHPGIQSAILPQDKSLFDVMVTEVTKSGLFFVQVGDRDTAQNLKKLSEELNAFYHSSQPTSYQPQPNQFCAAHFTETGDWCRAFIKEIDSDHFVKVHYIDYGNTEKLSMSSIRPLMDNFTTFPSFALPCSLANITQPESPGWPDEAIKLIKEKVPLSQRVSAKAVGKRRGMLFVDFIISQDPPLYLSQLLLNEGFAQTSTRGDRQAGDTHREIQVEHSHAQEESLFKNSASSSRPLGGLESHVFEPAIQSFAVLDSFNAMLTNVASPDSIFIQILSLEKVQSLEQLSTDLNAHYNGTNYPPFQAQTNLMCAGLFSGSGDWCRAFINRVMPDGLVHVHYLDYGNSEVLSLSQVRPLAKNFQLLPPMALKCSLFGIRPMQSSGWSDSASGALLSQVPLFTNIEVKVIRKESGSLVIDATSPDSPSQETLSQFLINQGMAQWQDVPRPPREHMQPLGERRYSGKRADLPRQSSPGTVCTGNNRVYASAIPVVGVSQNTSLHVLISEVQRPDKIFFQVINQENAQGLETLSEMLDTHCSTVDDSPYKPVLGELCCARFSQDGMWYRAVVEQELSESKMLVMFVDYGNQDSVAVNSIRRITTAFMQLPLQARQCFLAGIHPMSHSSWSLDAVSFLKERLISQCFIAEIENMAENEVGVQLFEVGPNRQRSGISINLAMIQRNFALRHEHSVCPRLQMSVPNEDQFDVVVTEVIHPGEMWAQVMDAESRKSLSLLMEQINQHCTSALAPSFIPNPGQECCALFSSDNTWYRARVLECPQPGEIIVQYVDFGNSELMTADKIRPIMDEFFELPAQAFKLSLANVRPAHQVWNQEVVEWLKNVLNRELKATVVHRLPEHLVVSLEDWAAPEGPCNINEELVRMRFAVKC